MKKLFLLLGLIEYRSLQLDLSREEFIRVLSPHVGADTMSGLDIFSSGKTDYKGAVGYNGFYLRRKRGWVNNSRHYCKVIGIFQESSSGLVVNLEFRYFPPPVYFFLIMIFLFGAFSILLFFIGLFTFNGKSITNAVLNMGAVFGLGAIVGFITRSFSANAIQKMYYELDANIFRYRKAKL